MRRVSLTFGGIVHHKYARLRTKKEFVMIGYMFVIGVLLAVVLLLIAVTWALVKRSKNARVVSPTTAGITVVRKKGVIEYLFNRHKNKATYFLAWGGTILFSLGCLTALVWLTIWAFGYTKRKFPDQYETFINSVGDNWHIPAIAIASVIGLLVLIQFVVNRKKRVDKKKKKGILETETAESMKKRWEDAKKKIGTWIDVIRNLPFLFVVYIPAGWFLFVSVVLKYFEHDLLAYKWIRIDHPRLFWATPFVFLLGYFFFRIQSVSLKVVGALIWLPLAYLWISEGRKEIPENYRIFGGSNSPQVVFDPPPTGLNYKDLRNVTSDWSEVVNVPFKRKFTLILQGDRPACIKIKLNNDDRLIYPHDFGRDGDLDFEKLGVERVECFQVRSFGGPDIGIRVVFKKM